MGREGSGEGGFEEMDGDGDSTMPRPHVQRPRTSMPRPHHFLSTRFDRESFLPCSKEAQHNFDPDPDLHTLP